MLAMPRPRHMEPQQQLARLAPPLSLLLILLLLLQTLPPAPPRPFVPPPPAPALQPATPAARPVPLPADLAGKPELEALRTATSATFDLGDGRYGVLSDILPLHYQAEDGSWQPINPAFEAVEGGWLNRANTLQTGVGQRSSAAKVSAGDAGVGWEPQALAAVGAGGEEQLAAPLAEGAPGLRSGDGTIVRYRAGWSLPGLEDQWQSRRGLSEYSMRLGGLPATTLADPQELALTVRLHLLAGTRIEAGGRPLQLPLETGAPLEFTADDGARLRLEPPYAFEQRDYLAGTVGRYALRQIDAQTVELKVLLPWAWLSAPERSYPVVIDPRFMLTGQSEARTFVWRWVLDGSGGWKLAEHGTLQGAWLGSWGRPDLEYYVSRLAVRFGVPNLPPGATIDSAYITAIPTGVNGGSMQWNGGGTNQDVTRTFLMAPVQASAILSDGWVSPPSSMPHPQVEQAQLPVAGSNLMLYSKGASMTGVSWNVSAKANGWRPSPDASAPKFNHNPGVMLRASDENCFRGYVPLMPNCGAFAFGDTPTSWSDEDLAYLEEMHDQSTPAGPFVDPSSISFGGLRMVAFYSAATLQEGQPIKVDGGLHPTDKHPYFHAGTKYLLPGIAQGKWQAVAARSFAPGFGTPTPDAPGERWTVPITGGMQLRLSNPGASDIADPAFTLDAVSQGKVSYLALNGRASGGFGVGQSLWLDARNGYVGGGATGYDVRLIGQRDSIATTSIAYGTLVTSTFTFDSADPLALVDLRFPQASNSQVRVRAISQIPELQEYAAQFEPQVVFSEGRSRVVASEGQYAQGLRFAMGPLNTVESGNIHQGASRFFTPQGNKFYALALAYNGPYIKTVPDPVIPTFAPEGAEVAPQAGPNMAQDLRFTIQVSIVSCEAGAFPFGGGCQPVRCPAGDALSTYSNYFESGGMAIWNPNGLKDTAVEGGELVAGTTRYDPSDPNRSAPLIGSARINGERHAPQVAIIGGEVRFDTRPSPDVVTTSGGDVLLVDCAQSPPAYLHVYSGALERTTITQELPNAVAALAEAAGAEATADNAAAEGQRFDPAAGAEGAVADAAVVEAQAQPFDLGPEFTPEAAPPGANGKVALRGTAANPLAQMKLTPWEPVEHGDLANAGFYVTPAVGRAGGAATLNRQLPDGAGTRSVAFTPRWAWDVRGWPGFAHAIGGVSGVNLPDIASLRLRIAGPYQLDVTPVSNPEADRFFEAIRTFSGTVSQREDLGGDRRTVQVVILRRGLARPSEEPAACSGSCVDLRGPADRPGFLDRVWTMPDVHTATPVGTVTLSRAGELLVYSKDHPLAAQGFDQEFSFDAYSARVSVEQAPCDAGGPTVAVVRGEAGVALPNIGDGAASPIRASFKLCDGELRTVHMEFTSPVGIPVGASGLFLTGLQGTVDIKPDHTVVTLGISFQTEPAGDGGIFKGSGTVIIDSAGLFEFQGTGTVLGTVNADGRVWVAWNKLDVGFDVGVSVGSWLRGSAYAHMWQGRGWDGRYTWLPDDDTLHFAGEISATLTIEEGAVVDWWEIQLPPSDISFSVVVAFGEFCTNSSCTAYEWGIKGKFVLLGYDVGLYYGFDKGLDFILGNDDHVLIDQYGGAQSMTLASGEEVPVRAAAVAVAGVADEPLEVGPEVEQILVGLGWRAGSPELRLVRPDGQEITPANAVQHGAEFSVQADNILVGVRDPQPGTWTVRVAGLGEARDEGYRLLILSNKGAPGDDSAALAAGELTVTPAAGGARQIAWAVPAGVTAASPAKIDLYYRLVAETKDNLHQGVPIMKNLPYAQGSYLWTPAGLVNGEYEVYAEVHDGVNELPVDQISIPDNTCLPLNGPVPAARAFAGERFPGARTMVAAQRVTVADTTAPATPSGLSVAPGSYALLATWTPSADLDVQSYRLRWGPRTIAGDITFRAEQIVSGRDSAAWRIGAVQNGLQYGVTIEALDANGNSSAASAPAFATPSGAAPAIPLAPKGLARDGAVLGGVKLAWQPGDSVVPAAYEVVATRVDLGQPQKVRVETAATSATVTGLAVGGTYDVKLRARNAGGWYSAASDPLRVVVSGGADGDGDGLADDWAAARAVSGAGDDADGDGLSNLEEFQLGTDPRLQDSDDDGKSDLEERDAGTDPLGSSSYGAAYTQPRLALERDTLTFRVMPGASVAAAGDARSVAWSNVGGGTLQLRASPSHPWITASVNGDKVEVGVRAGLKPGFYSGVVRLTQAGGERLIGAPQCVRVKAWVYPGVGQAPLHRVFLPLLAR